MGILEDLQHRPAPCQRFPLRNQGFQRFLPALLRGQVKRGIPSIVRQRQHRRNECGVLSWGRALRKRRIKLVELRLWGVVTRQSSGMLQLTNDRIKRTVGMLRRAEVAQARMRLGGEAFQKFGCKPRFTDPRLTGQQHDLASTALDLRPGLNEQFELFLRADGGSTPARVQRLEATSHETRPPRRVGAGVWAWGAWLCSEMRSTRLRGLVSPL